MHLPPTSRILKHNMNVKNKLISALRSLKNQLTSMSKDNAAAAAAAAAPRRILAGIEAAVAKSSGSSDRLPDGRYVNEILFLISASPGSITFLARRLSERLGTSPCFARSVKTLALLHRLLRGGDRFFEHDMRLLWSSGELRISPQLHSAAFVINYSLFLQERLEWRINPAGKLEPVRPQGLELQEFGEKAAELVLYNVSKCQLFLDRAMACLPESRNLEQRQLSVFVLNIIVRESFRVYESFCEDCEIVMASFFELKRASRVSALGVLRKAIWQTPKLQEFYDFCDRVIKGKNMEFPTVRTITEEDISSMVRFAVAEEASDEEDKQMKGIDEKLETKISTVWVRFNEGEDDPPLAEGEGSENNNKRTVLL